MSSESESESELFPAQYLLRILDDLPAYTS